MREEDNLRVGPRGECIYSEVERDRRMAEERAERTRSARARASTRSSLARLSSLRLSEGVPGGENLSNKYREERTHECRQKSLNDQLRRELLRRVRLFPEIPADF